MAAQALFWLDITNSKLNVLPIILNMWEKYSSSIDIGNICDVKIKGFATLRASTHREEKRCPINIDPAINPLFIIYEHSILWVNFFVERKRRD